ncbi:MAG: GTPase family protein [Thermoguttaceae bacterium]
MKRIKTWWLLLFLVYVFPYIPLAVAGFVWLYERRLLWTWLVLTGVVTTVGWGVGLWLRARTMGQGGQSRAGRRTAGEVQPDPRWAPTGQTAWHKVEAIAQRAQKQDLPLDRPDPTWKLFREVLETVAHEFRPDAKEPAMEVPLPQALRTAELVARDLREVLSENVPGSHIFTLGDLKRLHKLAAWGQQWYFVYRFFLRIGRFSMNPVSALVSEVRDVAAGDFWETSTVEMKRWAVGFCVRQAGFYAIQMYSGQAVGDESLSQYQTQRSQQDADRAQTADKRLAEEPLRILVLGQVKAGKSSLINALFGETRAAVDVVPRTRNVEPYLLQREGIPTAIILDTAGYEDQGDESPFAGLEKEVAASDVVLLVCSAQSASRAADRRLLDALRAFFHARPDRVPPPLVAALTHIDQLRPLAEWNPPYDLAHPVGLKAENIRDAMQAVEQDLRLTPDQVVAPVCLRPDRLYNVEEGLAPAILTAMPEAQRVKYLRALRQYHDEEYWRQLWVQTLNTGRVLLKAGSAWLKR